MAELLFKNIHILIADNDALLARALAQNLRVMGFPNTHYVRNGSLALKYIQENPVDLLITEWYLTAMNGLQLIQKIRGLSTPKRTIPIIMLTGKGELQDVAVARDVGITEFVIKPFTATTLYRRIEQIVDFPRGFLVADSYAGPDRRRKPPPEGKGSERRSKPPLVIETSDSMKGRIKLPALIKPDYGFKKSMGITGSLSAILTPEVLANAQMVIDSMADESLEWIRKDIMQLQKSHNGIFRLPSHKLLEDAKEAALSIKSRAGTFGYPLASEVARQLYLFLCTDFDPQRRMHLKVMEKHTETIQVIIAQKIKETNGIGAELLSELKRLVVLQK